MLVWAGVSVSLAGCALAPGLYMDKDQIPDNQKGKSGYEAGNIKPVFVPINADTVSRQVPYDPVAKFELPVSQGLPPARESVENYKYHVGPGDVLTVIVWNHPGLTNPQGNQSGNRANTGRIVRADGTIFYPFVGDLHVGGLTVEQIRKRLTRKLKRYIPTPQVGVRVVRFRAHRVYITGYVNEPGIQYLDDQPLTVMDAVNQAGGMADEANQRKAILTRNGKEYLIDLLALYSRKSAASNVVLKPGDTLYVPNDASNRVYVMGEVNQQSALALNHGQLSLAQALTEAQGDDQDKADAEGIYVIRGLERQIKGSKQAKLVPVVYHLNASNPAALVLASRFELQPGDVVFVSGSKFTRFNRALEQILPTIDALFKTESLIRAGHRF
jgi:polysaccharide export outer membrane protein